MVRGDITVRGRLVSSEDATESAQGNRNQCHQMPRNLHKITTRCGRSPSADNHFVLNDETANKRTGSRGRNTSTCGVSSGEKRGDSEAVKSRGMSSNGRRAQNATIAGHEVIKRSALSTVVHGACREDSLQRRQSAGIVAPETHLRDHLECGLKEVNTNTSPATIRTSVHARGHSIGRVSGQSRRQFPSPKPQRVSSSPMLRSIDLAHKSNTRVRKATSDRTINDENLDPALHRLIHENETLKEAVLDNNRRLARLEDEKWHFLNEGIFDLMNSVYRGEKLSVKPTGASCMTDLAPPFLPFMEEASGNHAVSQDQRRPCASGRSTDHTPSEVADTDTIEKLVCWVESPHSDATYPNATQGTNAIIHDNFAESGVLDADGETANVCSTTQIVCLELNSGDEVKDSGFKLRSLEQPCTQPPDTPVGGTPSTCDNVFVESEFGSFSFGSASVTAFTIPLDLDESGDLSFSN